MFEFESPADLVLGLVTGICFGFLLQKGRVAKYQTILGQLLLKDWTVFKIMITAIVTGGARVLFPGGAGPHKPRHLALSAGRHADRGRAFRQWTCSLRLLSR